MCWFAFKFPKGGKDGPAPLKSVWVEEMNIVIQEMMKMLSLPPTSLTDCEARCRRSMRRCPFLRKVPRI